MQAALDDVAERRTPGRIRCPARRACRMRRKILQRQARTGARLAVASAKLEQPALPFS
jgi:hypothetical protein